MQFKAFLAAAFAATAMAQDSSLASELASITSNLATLSIPLPSNELSIFSVLATAVPPGFVTALSDPAVSASFASELSAGNAPSWYSALPSDVRSYIDGAASAASAATDNASLSSAVESITASISSVAASVTSQLSADASSVGASVSSRLSAASASASATGSSSATSTGGAPAPTGAVVASMAGVIGVLALAIGL
ncbi:hypothetical protein EPUS_05994 [Endocarpon pusillum Z07020]|uniref:Uncharacterized protein n=1 Tax=Endocarpon pusillum (strain Z07020 / HMAS-L-300199) TaxID=1263415 RepID=U1HLM7_ENDPU|nr:uncharacterized protein EPUS_05994 [Endocarpon pusillum Z07020]ERF71165.1 hypothetical protein EPUS_05994 [Endocarpon pusillum Z07020]